jgi:hypothetical protein
MSDPRSTPPPKLGPKAAAALARVQSGRGRRSQRPARRPVRWVAVLVLVVVGATAVALLRLAADRNLERVALSNAPNVPAANQRTPVVDRPPEAFARVPLEQSTRPLESGDQASEASTPPAAPTDRPDLADFNRRLRALEGLPPPNCRPRSFAPDRSASTAAVYRWRDPESGQAQFGSSPPAGIAAERVELKDRGQAQFALQVEDSPDAPVPSQLRDRALADVVRITAILRQELAVPIDPRFGLKLAFVASPEAVGAAAGGLGLARASGVYMHREQRMLIWRQPRDEGTFRTLRHEVVHALLHEFVGAPPIWLNEGLAEYFELMQTLGSSGRIEANRHHQRLLSGFTPDQRIAHALTLLEIDGQGFRREPMVDLNYAQSWALVDALMGSKAGQAQLTHLLADLRQAACGRFSSTEWLNTNYPGGASALARLADGQRGGAHHY